MNCPTFGGQFILAVFFYTKAALISSWAYAVCGRKNTSSAAPCSIIRPLRITATSCEIALTARISCEIKR